jgi:hypothetical protein
MTVAIPGSTGVSPAKFVCAGETPALPGLPAGGVFSKRLFSKRLASGALPL